MNTFRLAAIQSERRRRDSNHTRTISQRARLRVARLDALRAGAKLYRVLSILMTVIKTMDTLRASNYHRRDDHEGDIRAQQRAGVRIAVRGGAQN